MKDERKSTNTAWTVKGYTIRLPDGVTYRVAGSVFVDDILTVVFLPLPAYKTKDSGRCTYTKDREMSADEYMDDK